MKILIATHSYGLNGAAILLRAAAQHWVQQKQWQVDALMSEEDIADYGPALNAVGIKTKTMVSDEPNQYDVAVVNTLLDIELVEKLSISMPVVLWAHEGNTLLFNWNIPLSKLTHNFSKCNQIIFQTNWQSEHVFKSFLNHLPPERIQHIPSGVVTEGIPYKNSHKLSTLIKIISVGSVYPRKRQMDLVNVVDNLAKQYPIECSIVGDYSQAIDWLPRIKSDIDNPEAKVKWLGSINDRNKVNELLQQSDIACFPSGDESHPLALLESGVCAVPMVVSNLPPYSHIGWIDGKNCLMHPIGNLVELQGKIERLIKDESLRVRLANNARKMVLNKYTEEKFFQNIDKTLVTYKKNHD